MSPYYIPNSDLTLTNVSPTSCSVGYNPFCNYPIKKEESVKERRIREKRAFVLFYKKNIFITIDTKVFSEPSNIESCNRSSKFKIKSDNLIQKTIH